MARRLSRPAPAPSPDDAPRSVEDARGGAHTPSAPRRPAARPVTAKGAKLTDAGVVLTIPLDLYPAIRWAVQRKRDDVRFFKMQTDAGRQVDDQLSRLLDILPTSEDLSATLRTSIYGAR